MKSDLAGSDDQIGATDGSVDPPPGRGVEKTVAASVPRDPALSQPYADLRVAYLINQYPKVSHTFIRREIRALERLGAQVTRIALRGWDAEVVDDQDVEERARTTYVLKNGLWPLFAAVLRTAVNRPRRFLTGLKAAISMSRKSMRPLPYHLIYLAHACSILPSLEKLQISHLHAHFGTNTSEVAMLVRLLGGPEYSFTVHGPDEIDDAKHLGFDRTIPAAKFVAAISSYTRSQLQRHVNYESWEKIKLVHCGIDRQFFDDDGASIPATAHFVCVGRLSEQKGQLALLEAFSSVQKRHPACRLVLAGDGEMRPILEDQIRALGLHASVRITGWISSAEVRAEILGARALVLPSFQEGLPVVIMEAMALRRPVISTYIAGIPELVTPGETGWLIPAGSVIDLVNAIEACIEASDDDVLRMGAAARRRVLERHSIDTEAAKLGALFAAPSL